MLITKILSFYLDLNNIDKLNFVWARIPVMTLLPLK